MRLDRSRNAGEQVTWDVLVPNLNANQRLGQEGDAYLTEKVTAASLEMEDGALVFRAENGELVKLYGPSGYLEVTRA